MPCLSSAQVLPSLCQRTDANYACAESKEKERSCGVACAAVPHALFAFHCMNRLFSGSRVTRIASTHPKTKRTSKHETVIGIAEGEKGHDGIPAISCGGQLGSHLNWTLPMRQPGGYVCLETRTRSDDEDVTRGGIRELRPSIVADERAHV